MPRKKLLGRPMKEIDKKVFEKLCQLHCTQEEISFFFDCSPDTILRWCKRTYGATFEEVYRAKKAGLGDVSLRRAQWAKAMTGKDTKMLIWLGKQYLNQTDKVETKNETNINATAKLDDLVAQLNDDDEDDD